VRVYIAGPMRGIDRWNFPAFDAAEKRWKEAGHEVASPASIDRALGLDENGPLSQVNGDFARRAMAMDIQILYHSDAIALLPGWERSSGATVELSLSQYLGLETFNAETMEKILVPSRPWSAIPQHYRSRLCT
jgi:hypothetical protein